MPMFTMSDDQHEHYKEEVYASCFEEAFQEYSRHVDADSYHVENKTLVVTVFAESGGVEKKKEYHIFPLEPVCLEADEHAWSETESAGDGLEERSCHMCGLTVATDNDSYIEYKPLGRGEKTEFQKLEEKVSQSTDFNKLFDNLRELSEFRVDVGMGELQFSTWYEDKVVSVVDFIDSLNWDLADVEDMNKLWGDIAELVDMFNAKYIEDEHYFDLLEEYLGVPNTYSEDVPDFVLEKYSHHFLGAKYNHLAQVIECLYIDEYCSEFFVLEVPFENE